MTTEDFNNLNRYPRNGIAEAGCNCHEYQFTFQSDHSTLQISHFTMLVGMINTWEYAGERLLATSFRPRFQPSQVSGIKFESTLERNTLESNPYQNGIEICENGHTLYSESSYLMERDCSYEEDQLYILYQYKRLITGRFSTLNETFSYLMEAYSNAQWQLTKIKEFLPGDTNYSVLLNNIPQPELKTSHLSNILQTRDVLVGAYSNDIGIIIEDAGETYLALLKGNYAAKIPLHAITESMIEQVFRTDWITETAISEWNQMKNMRDNPHYDAIYRMKDALKTTEPVYSKEKGIPLETAMTDIRGTTVKSEVLQTGLTRILCKRLCTRLHPRTGELLHQVEFAYACDGKNRFDDPIPNPYLTTNLIRLAGNELLVSHSVFLPDTDYQRLQSVLNTAGCDSSDWDGVFLGNVQKQKNQNSIDFSQNAITDNTLQQSHVAFNAEEHDRFVAISMSVKGQPQVPLPILPQKKTTNYTPNNQP